MDYKSIYSLLPFFPSELHSKFLSLFSSFLQYPLEIIKNQIPCHTCTHICSAPFMASSLSPSVIKHSVMSLHHMVCETVKTICREKENGITLSWNAWKEWHLELSHWSTMYKSFESMASEIFSATNAVANQSRFWELVLLEFGCILDPNKLKSPKSNHYWV